MAENPDIIETLTKHLPSLRIYQVKIFLKHHQKDTWKIKLSKKIVKCWMNYLESSMTKKNVSGKHAVPQNTVSIGLKNKEMIL